MPLRGRKVTNTRWVEPVLSRPPLLLPQDLLHRRASIGDMGMDPRVETPLPGGTPVARARQRLRCRLRTGRPTKTTMKTVPCRADPGRSRTGLAPISEDRLWGGTSRLAGVFPDLPGKLRGGNPVNEAPRWPMIVPPGLPPQSIGL
jgi:hypothetical protein